MRILYVEDEPVYQIIVKKLLENDGLHTVDIVGSMSECRNMLSNTKERPELILMDIILPEESNMQDRLPDGGITLAEELTDQNIPIIFISVYCLDRYADRINKLTHGNSNRYFAKPLDFKGLIVAVNEFAKVL